MDKTKTKVLKVAVTGGAGSGKTVVCNRLKERGLNVISVDAIAREAVAPGSPAHQKIVDFFGTTVLLKDRTLNRKMLRQRIINDAGARRVLERIVHPEISKLFRKQMICTANGDCGIVVAEVPLLFELDMQQQFDRVVFVNAARDLRVKRLMVRDHISRDDAEDLLNIQMPDEEKIKRADFVLSNEGSKAQLIRAVDILYENAFKPYEIRKSA